MGCDGRTADHRDRVLWGVMAGQLIIGTVVLSCDGRTADHRDRVLWGVMAGQLIIGTVVLVHLLLFRNLDNFVNHTLHVSFGRHTKICCNLLVLSTWCLGEVKDPTRKVEDPTHGNGKRAKGFDLPKNKTGAALTAAQSLALRKE